MNTAKKYSEAKEVGEVAGDGEKTTSALVRTRSYRMPFILAFPTYVYATPLISSHCHSDIPAPASLISTWI
jgi:hypothetical protein